MSDNGTQFTSQEFQSYCQQHGIQHIRSPPYHPQSNGQADTFKRTFQKLRWEGATSDVIQKFLWTYRSTPRLCSPGQKTPAENCIGRQLRTSISVLQLQSHLQREAMKGKAQKMHKVQGREFAEGDTVYLRMYEDPRGQWAPGVVIRRLGTVLYDVRSSNKIVRRHANQLRPRSVDDALNVMLETFNLPLLPLSKPHTEQGSSNPVVTDSVKRRGRCSCWTRTESMAEEETPTAKIGVGHFKEEVQLLLGGEVLCWEPIRVERTRRQ